MRERKKYPHIRSSLCRLLRSTTGQCHPEDIPSYDIIGSPSACSCIIASSVVPFWLWLRFRLLLLLALSWPRPRSSFVGRSFFASRAFSSAQTLNLTKLRSLASGRTPWLWRMASLTRIAILLRNSGSRSAASEGVKSPLGKIRRDSVCSRSSRNCGSVGARGARWDVANSRAGATSPFGVEVQERINSTSWSRRRAKWREGLLSSIYALRGVSEG